MVGMSKATPKRPKTTRALRAFPTDQPRLISRPESQPLEKIGQIGGHERNPDGDQAASESNSFGDEIDRKPIGDEKKDRVGEGSGNDGSPGLRELQKIAPARGVFFGRFVLFAIGQDHLPLGETDAKMVLE
jgi:hypothetical protein